MQPLFRVRPNANAAFGNDDTMVSRPKVAVKIAECIGEWANIESMLAVFLGLLLRGDSKAILAMYMALENRSAQLRALQAAADAKLSTRQSDIFEGILIDLLRPLMRTRDKLAHWCWGYSPELPNDLLIMEPNEKLLLHFAALRGAIKLDDREVFVVTEKYLTTLLKEFLRAQTLLSRFIQVVASRSKKYVLPLGRGAKERERLLQQLLNEPEIRKGVDRRRASRKTPPPTRPQSPEEVTREKSKRHR